MGAKTGKSSWQTMKPHWYVKHDSTTHTGVCEKTPLLLEPRPRDPAAETAIQPQIGCFQS